MDNEHETGVQTYIESLGVKTTRLLGFIDFILSVLSYSNFPSHLLFSKPSSSLFHMKSGYDQ